MPEPNDSEFANIELNIRFLAEIDSTHRLAELMFALEDIELLTLLWRQNDRRSLDLILHEYYRFPFPHPYPEYLNLYENLGGIKLKSVRMDSPLNLNLIGNIDWLAILLILYAAAKVLDKYKTWRESAVLITQDALKFASSIKNLSKKQRAELEGRIKAFLSWIAASGEDFSLQMAGSFHRIHQRLSQQDMPLEITVIQGEPEEHDLE
jgi:hypothetical protein